jgi:acyl carrier protein
MEKVKFTFDDPEFLYIVNIILKEDHDEDEEYEPITSMDDSFNLHGLDSLSVMMFFIWVSDFFGIPEDKFQELAKEKDFTIRTLKDFISREATQTFTYNDAMAYSKHSFNNDDDAIRSKTDNSKS